MPDARILINDMAKRYLPRETGLFDHLGGHRLVIFLALR
jgi:hypothetical protein